MQKTITFNRDTKDFDMHLNGEYKGSRARHIEAEVELDRLAFEAAQHAAGPVDQAVEGALERLAEESAGAMRLARADHDKAGGTFWQRATTSYANALIEYRKGVRPELLQSGAWLLPSRRAGEAPHIVCMDGDWTCSCKAGAAMHWSLALIIGIEVAHDDMQRFDGGDTAPEDAPALATEDDGSDQDALEQGGYARAKRRYYAARDARLACAGDLDFSQDGPIVRLLLVRPVYRCRCGAETEGPGDCYGCLSRGPAYPMGTRLSYARRPLFAAFDAETAQKAAKGELRAELEALRARRNRQEAA